MFVGILQSGVDVDGVAVAVIGAFKVSDGYRAVVRPAVNRGVLAVDFVLAGLCRARLALDGT